MLLPDARGRAGPPGTGRTDHVSSLDTRAEPWRDRALDSEREDRIALEEPREQGPKSGRS